MTGYDPNIPCKLYDANNKDYTR